MGYMHIDNLYKNQAVLALGECYALEKLHGTSAHVAWDSANAEPLSFFSGGEKHASFVALFDETSLREKFKALGHAKVVVYGEAYGGSQQGQKWRYGEVLRFAAFDVMVDACWLDVPQAHAVVRWLGLEFVHYVKVPTELRWLDAERDASSMQALRNGCGCDKPREGVVLRPIVEQLDRWGHRIIAKHKRDDERETATPRKIVDPARLKVLSRAIEIADEWVTPTRLEHVLAKLGGDLDMSRTVDVIAAMIEDVTREGVGEIVDSREARSAIGKKTAGLLKAMLQAQLSEGPADERQRRHL